MFRSFIFALSILVGYVAAQTGVDLDAPMLAGGPRGGSGAMLRFGCSQVVIERLDPYVGQVILEVEKRKKKKKNNKF